MSSMTYKESLIRFGLVPADTSLKEIRGLLAHEAQCERVGQQRQEDLALLCCVQLFSRAHLEDVLRIWEAKESSWDMHCYLDVQLLCGAGLEETKSFLISQSSPEAAAALEYILDCEDADDFEDFTPAKYLIKYHQYFKYDNH